MYLTDKFADKPHTTQDHQAAELLLEYYERRLDEVNESSHRLSSLLGDVDNNICELAQTHPCPAVHLLTQIGARVDSARARVDPGQAAEPGAADGDHDARARRGHGVGWVLRNESQERAGG